MKLINDLNLLHEPLQLKFSFTTLSGFPGYFHAHQGIEILYVHSGAGDVLLNRQMYEIRDHTLLIFQPYQLHRIRMNATPEKPYTRSKFMIEPSFLDEKMSFAPELSEFFRSIWKREILQPVLYGMNASPRFAALMEDYRERFRSMNGAGRQEASILFCLEFFHLLKHGWEQELFGAKEGAHLRESHHAEIIIGWLEAHLHEPLRLDQLAQDLHLSKHHLSRLFKRATGSTISEFLNILRAQKACRLLETSVLSVEQIAQKVGVSDTSYFCEIFKRFMGQTPLQYRLGLYKRTSEKPVSSV
ncbi:AraC family transcriptional regulator [Paenibacillus contaminans]|uniref:AraC family transcriptional regulator n=1 Tax=Paenibacillus contaminans TaxID=450362 RepID=A0A329MKI7_9BACL|nr:AraC family transcriptional regulator [Paenibacillus contaminans]RAV20088.1 AraC family transcriptional regulator [Paenibacillus contaminans]